MCRGGATWGGVRKSCPPPPPPTSSSKRNKVQQFQFQTSGILFFMGVKKLYGPEISRLFFLQYNWLQLVKTKNEWKIFHKETTKKETRKYNTSTYLTALWKKSVEGEGWRKKLEIFSVCLSVLSIYLFINLFINHCYYLIIIIVIYIYIYILF